MTVRFSIVCKMPAAIREKSAQLTDDVYPEDQTVRHLIEQNQYAGTGCCETLPVKEIIQYTGRRDGIGLWTKLYRLCDL